MSSSSTPSLGFTVFEDQICIIWKSIPAGKSDVHKPRLDAYRVPSWPARSINTHSSVSLERRNISLMKD